MRNNENPFSILNTSRKERKPTYARKSNVRALFSDKSWQLVSCTLGNQVSKQIFWENSWGWDLGCCCHCGRLAGTADANSPGRLQIFQEANYSCLLEVTRSSLPWPSPRHAARDSQRQILKAPEKHSTDCIGIWPAQSRGERQDQKLNRILPLRGSLTGSSSLSPSLFCLESYPSPTRATPLQCLLHGVFLPLKSISTVNSAHTE